MNAFLYLVAGPMLVFAAVIIAIAPNFRTWEKRLRWIGAGLTFSAGVLNIVIGLRSAAKMDVLVRNTQEASSYASGGDSFPLVHAHVIPSEGGGQQIGFYFQKEGKYPLYGLSVWAGKPYKRSPSDTTIYYAAGGFGQRWQLLDDSGSRAIWFQPTPKEQSTLYSVNMSARNGNWEEVCDVERISSGFAIRWVLFGSNDPRITPNKLIFDLADDAFPSSKRHEKIYPLSEVALPIAREP